MNVLSSLRRCFVIYDNEKAGVNCLANVLACQMLALLQEGMHPEDISKAIEKDETLRAYLIGLSYQANDVYKMGDFEYLLVTLAHLIDQVLNRSLISHKVDFADMLIKSFNNERKKMSPQFEKGLALANEDISLYLAGAEREFEKKQLVWDKIPTKAKTLGPAFNLFKHMKEAHL